MDEDEDGCKEEENEVAGTGLRKEEEKDGRGRREDDVDTCSFLETFGRDEEDEEMDGKSEGEEGIGEKFKEEGSELVVS